MKVRIEVENSGYALQPGMFVNVEFPVTAPPCVNLPADAIINSGVKQTVFVDRGGGFSNRGWLKPEGTGATALR